MVSQHRKRRGYETQRIVARYLRRWWPYAEATGAGLQGTDITGTPGVPWEIKARRELDLLASMRQAAEHRVSGGRYAPVVVRPDGYGEARIADWPTILPLWAVVELFVIAGYGTAEVPTQASPEVVRVSDLASGSAVRQFAEETITEAM